MTTESILVKKLQRICTELKTAGKPDNVIINTLKQELHYTILDFIYNHPQYSHLIMYGGTLLRIVYALPRMSEDLDFQTHEEINLQALAEALIKHFKDKYNLQVEVVVKPRDIQGTHLLVIKFDILEAFNLEDIKWTIIKIRFDVNIFDKAGDFVKESHPIVHEGLTFSILTYPLSTLMASKIRAVLHRTNRGIGDKMAACKPRDIYDFIWYLDRKAIPDMEYLKAQGEPYETIYELFYGVDNLPGLKFRVANLPNDLFEEDLAQFFFDRTDFDNWLSNWKTKFETLMNSYKIYKIKELDTILFNIDFSTDIRTINYIFTTDQTDRRVRFAVKLSEYWFIFNDVKIVSGHRQTAIETKVESAKLPTALDYEYIGLFYKKIKEFCQKNKDVLLNDQLSTKVIRATADQLRPIDQIYLDKRILENIQFEELM